MARYNVIFAGPVGSRPQTQEAVLAASLLPGIAVVWSSGQFAAAGAATNEKVLVLQDNYLAGKGVDDAWASGDRGVALEMLDGEFFNVRVATGNNLVKGSKLTTNSSGKFVLATTGNRIVAIAEEAFNNNTGSDQLVRVRAAKGHLAP